MNEASFAAPQKAASLKNEREIAWAASAIPPVMTIQPSSNLIRWLQSEIVLFFLVNFTFLKKWCLLRAPTMTLFSCCFFYGWSAYPLIKSFFIRACQTIMFYLFRIPFVSDLKWNHIWGNSKRGVMVPAVAPSAYSLHPWKAHVLQMEISIFQSTGSYANNHLSMKRALNYILMWNKNRDGPCAKEKKTKKKWNS